MGPLEIHEFLYPNYDPNIFQKLVTSSFGQVLPTKHFYKDLVISSGVI